MVRRYPDKKTHPGVLFRGVFLDSYFFASDDAIDVTGVLPFFLIAFFFFFSLFFGLLSPMDSSSYYLQYNIN